MGGRTPGLVDIVRDFVSADAALCDLVKRYREGTLRWEEVSALVADDEESPLYRLKERSHALFRSETAGAPVARHREVLFDLAVGSLFHEAMKFRENFYQSVVYGPRVRELRREAGAEAEALFGEFERMFEAGAGALGAGAAETEALLARIREQLVDLLAQHSRDGHVARFLVEQSGAVEAALGQGLSPVFAAVYGSEAAGWELAGRSYVVSGYFEEAGRALLAALERGGERGELAPLVDYAAGMAAYMRGEYASSVDHVGRWAAAAVEREPLLVSRACAALSRMDRLSEEADLVAAAELVVAELGSGKDER